MDRVRGGAAGESNVGRKAGQARKSSFVTTGLIEKGYFWDGLSNPRILGWPEGRRGRREGGSNVGHTQAGQARKPSFVDTGLIKKEHFRDRP